MIVLLRCLYDWNIQMTLTAWLCLIHEAVWAKNVMTLLWMVIRWKFNFVKQAGFLLLGFHSQTIWTREWRISFDIWPGVFGVFGDIGPLNGLFMQLHFLNIFLILNKTIVWDSFCTFICKQNRFTLTVCLGSCIWMNRSSDINYSFQTKDIKSGSGLSCTWCPQRRGARKSCWHWSWSGSYWCRPPESLERCGS